MDVWVIVVVKEPSPLFRVMSLEIRSDLIVTGLVNDASVLSLTRMVLTVRLFLHLYDYFISLNTFHDSI